VSEVHSLVALDFKNPLGYKLQMTLRMLSCCTALLLVFLPYNPALAADGRTWVEREGIALVKPQAWSKPAEAMVVEFSAYLNRSAAGQGAAGYYVLRQKNGTNRQIPAARVVKITLIPDVSQITNLVNDAETARLAAAVASLKGETSKYPATRRLLNSSIKELEGMLKRLDSGEVLVDGKWTSRALYYSGEARKLVAVLGPEIRSARPPGNVNLAADPRYAALQDLARKSPQAKRELQRIDALHERLNKESRQQAVLKELQNPQVSLARGRQLVTELSATSPSQTSEAGKLLQSWSEGDVLLQKIEKLTPEAVSAVNSSIAQHPDTEEAIALTPEATKIITELGNTVAEFRRSRPPRALSEAAAGSIQVVGFASAFAALSQQEKNNDYLAMKESLDRMAQTSPLISAEAEKYTNTLKKLTDERVAYFAGLREEATQLLEAGKKEDALKKFRAAYDVIPEQAISKNISALQKQIE